jgi:hypothetical protein
MVAAEPRTFKARAPDSTLRIIVCQRQNLSLCQTESKSRLDSYCFTSKRLLGDQLPGVPEEELARTRHHILVVGKVLVVNCEIVVFWFTTCGVAKVSSLSIWIV